MGAPETESVRKMELQRIASSNGGLLRPDDVVQAARDPGSPLHGCFEWDDSKAAHEYRVHIARNLISSFRLVTVRDGKSIRVPLYVHTGGRDQGYMEVTQVMDDTEVKRAAMTEEFWRTESALERAEGLAAYFGLELKVHRLRERVAHLREEGVSAPRAS